mgnify:CR=1 FL=1
MKLDSGAKYVSETTGVISEVKSKIRGFLLGIKPIIAQQLRKGLHPLSEQSFLDGLSFSRLEAQQELPFIWVQSRELLAENPTMDITKKESVTAIVFIVNNDNKI